MAETSHEKPYDYLGSETVNSDDSPLEVIRTISKVPGNENYYNKNGLRVAGDGEDHDNFQMTFKLFMALVGCSLAFVGSQMIALMFLTLFTSISADLSYPHGYLWLAAGGQLGQVAAAVSVGPLSDLLGRKTLLLMGVFFSLVGMVICSATPTGEGFIAGQTVAGFGLVIEELLAIACTAELVPTKRRTIYGSLMIAGFIPWTPGALYAQLLASVSWRLVGVLIAAWNIITIVVIGIFYNPPPRINAKGLSRRQIIQRIDFIGMILGLGGLTVFLLGLFWGGNPYPWNSRQVAGTLGAGAGILVLLVIYEYFFAKYPIFPRRLVQVPRAFWAIIFVIFTGGINYIPLVVFWPIESIAVFGSDHVRTGINTVAIGICILGGAVMSALLCGIFRRRVHWIMTGFCIIQTAGVGAMAAIKADNIATAIAPLVFGLWGVGGVLFPNQLVVTIITPDDLLSTVTSLTFAVRGVGQVISLAILQNRLTAEVTKNTIKYAAFPAIYVGINTVETITSLMTNLTAIPLQEYIRYTPSVDTPEKFELLRSATVEAFIHSFPIVYYIGLAFGGAACIACFVMGDISQYMDEHVAVVLH